MPILAVWTGDFDVAATASVDSWLRDPAPLLRSSPNPDRLLLPISSMLAGAADTTCVDARVSGVGCDSVMSKFIVFSVAISAGGWACDGIAPGGRRP